MSSEFKEPFSAYIFDCDGTLAASMKLHHAAWEYSVRRQVGESWAFPWDFFCTLGGMNTADTIAILENRYGFKISIEKLLPDYHAYLAEHICEVEPIPDVCAYARKLAARGAKLAVASGGFRKEVHEILKTIGVAELFPVVITSEDVANCKPAPDLFLLAAEKLGVPARECLVVEDSPKGFDAAEAAGMACMMVYPQ
ncbi:MAG: HAD family phosphatase [Opitutales bacterium]|nr:HAD family phosphatase [Verrucomicrobiota bacterium]MBQ2731928.1 HAD family phosphatase [Opitutales bacterium]